MQDSQCTGSRRPEPIRRRRRRQKRQRSSAMDHPFESTATATATATATTTASHSWRQRRCRWFGRNPILPVVVTFLTSLLGSGIPSGTLAFHQSPSFHSVPSCRFPRAFDSPALLTHCQHSAPTAYFGSSTLRSHAHREPFSLDDSGADDDLSSSSSSSSSSLRQIPRHVAFICDGNSRWAQHHQVSTAQGHWKGADRLVELVETLKEDGISYCTLYGFSTENWKRPSQEIQEIFAVIEHTARTLLPRLMQDSSSIQLRILGDLQDERIPLGVRKILQELQKMTGKQSNTSDESDDKSLTVCLAINYGGRQDILQATQKLAAAILAGEIQDDITDATLASYLSTSGIPDPDMIVRTSGEHRLSNFLLWNAAYSELYMTDVLWPDFDVQCWQEALLWYQQRHRRFGARSARQLRDDPAGEPTLSERQQSQHTSSHAVNAVGRDSQIWEHETSHHNQT